MSAPPDYNKLLSQPPIKFDLGPDLGPGCSEGAESFSRIGFIQIHPGELQAFGARLYIPEGGRITWSYSGHRTGDLQFTGPMELSLEVPTLWPQDSIGNAALTSLADLAGLEAHGVSTPETLWAQPGFLLHDAVVTTIGRAKFHGIWLSLKDVRWSFSRLEMGRIPTPGEQA